MQLGHLASLLELWTDIAGLWPRDGLERRKIGAGRGKGSETGERKECGFLLLRPRGPSLCKCQRHAHGCSYPGLVCHQRSPADWLLDSQTRAELCSLEGPVGERGGHEEKQHPSRTQRAVCPSPGPGGQVKSVPGEVQKKPKQNERVWLWALAMPWKCPGPGWVAGVARGPRGCFCATGHQ